MRYAIITDHTVAKLYGQDVLHYLGRASQLFSFLPGEASKSRATKEAIEDAMIAAGFSKETTVVGLGGGVVTDLAGFLASTFCRGVPLILIPTTLLAMVDAAIGGKNGVNTPMGKNKIGTIYLPQRTIFDGRFLATLPEVEWKNGFSEVIKHGLLANPELLSSFDIAEAIEVKRRIIAADLEEKNKRRLLNFGHKIGHALETLSNYQISHGEAVAKGIVMESRVAFEMGYLNPDAWDAIQKILPPASHTFDPDKILSAMARPYKLVMLRDIGEPLSFDGEYCTEVDPQLLRKILYEYAVHPAPVG